MCCSKRKMKTISVWAERFQKPLIRMLSYIGDFQRNLHLHVLFGPQNEVNIRLSWRAAETSHTHGINIFVQLHRWFSKEKIVGNRFIGHYALMVRKNRWKSLYWNPYYYWWGKIAGNLFIGRHNAIGRERSLEFALLDTIQLFVGKDRWNSLCWRLWLYW